MVFKTKIPPETEAYARFLRNERKMSLRKVGKKLNISASSVQRFSQPKEKQRRAPRSSVSSVSIRRGRPRKISEAEERYIIRELHKLRLKEGTFSVARLMLVTGINPTKVCRRTVLNVLHRNGYRFRQTRKKGLLSENDLKLRVQFARKMVRRPTTFWCDDIAFFLDAVGFVHKTNPLDQARAPGSRVYRKSTEGMSRGCTTKGKKEGTGGRYVKLIVGITHGKGVVICEPYEKMDGEFFADFIDKRFTDMFNRADKDSNVFVQDGDPSQNSAKAKAAMERCKAQLLSIPPRSPDVNPIENIFHLVSKKLGEDAIARNLTNETLLEFQQRVIRTIYSIPQQTIDNTISSTRNRLVRIIESKRDKDQILIGLFVFLNDNLHSF